MSKFNITFVSSQDGTIPKGSSPSTFKFANGEFDNLKDGYKALYHNSALTRHVELSGVATCRKNLADLKEFVPVKLTSLIVDLLDVYNSFNYKAIMEYFKEKSYSCIVFKGPNHDGFDSFNLRVIFRTNLTNKDKFLKIFLEQLQNDLGSKCRVDGASKSIFNTCRANEKSAILLHKENGKVIGDSDIYIANVGDIIDNPFEDLSEDDKALEEILEYKKKYSKELIDKCLELFFAEGYSIIPNNRQSKAVSFQKDGDKNYFWYPTTPFIMNHQDKKKRDSIFAEVKKTKEGRDWLKSQTKDKQVQELIKPFDLSSYKQSVICDERYLDLTKRNKIKLINDFLISEKGVFKIKSAMGTAKSNVIHEIIKRASKRGEKVIIVSNRISVALDFEDKYGIKTYQDYSTIKTKESVIVQYDSLHKYDPRDYDIAIFDEYASLLLHHRSNLSDNSNINAVKFKILTDSKRCVIADAFLTGYEDRFFEGRDIYALYNNYRDEVQLYEYKNQDYFVTQLIEKAEGLEEGEHMSCSFASLNILRVVEYELRERGIRVVALTSETSDLTKEIIYKKFKEDSHGAFQVILFTPTLTVGVSNLNNVKYHFHFDSGRGPDVISSLQMTKRSRLAEEIHYYVIESQKYADTDLNSINSVTKDKITNFYKGKDKTLLVNIDFNTGELELTPLALYINKIEVFYNILENNHGNAFKLLLNYQFTTNVNVIDTKSNNIKIQEKSKAINNKMRQDKLDLLEKYADVQWDYFEIEELKKKVATLTPEEQIKLMMYEIEGKFTKKPTKPQLKVIAKLEIESDFQFINYVKNMKTIMSPDFDSYARYELSNAMSEDLKSLQNRDQIQFLQYLIKLPYDFVLESSYEKKEIQAMDDKLKLGRRFAPFLTQLGYLTKEGKMVADTRVYKFIPFL